MGEKTKPTHDFPENTYLQRSSEETPSSILASI